MGFVRAGDKEVKSLAVPNLAEPVAPMDLAQFMGADAGGGQNDHKAPVSQVGQRLFQGCHSPIPASGFQEAGFLCRLGIREFRARLISRHGIPVRQKIVGLAEQ